jgi:hypothetical protein
MSAFPSGPFGRRPKTEGEERLSFSNFWLLEKQLAERARGRKPAKQRPDHEKRPICEANGGAERDRTDDLKLAKLALSQLSYSPDKSLTRRWRQMVGPGGVEPPTSRLSGVRSNHLSYEPRSVLSGQLEAIRRSSDAAR